MLAAPAGLDRGRGVAGAPRDTARRVTPSRAAEPRRHVGRRLAPAGAKRGDHGSPSPVNGGHAGSETPPDRRRVRHTTAGHADRREPARRHPAATVWSQIPGGLPASKVADTNLGDVVVVEATLVTTHSDKEGAASTFIRGCGYHPLGVWCHCVPGVAGVDAATRERRLEHHCRPHRGPDRGDRAGPCHEPQEPLDPRRRRRRVPWAARVADHSRCEMWPHTVEYSVGFAVPARDRQGP